MRKTGLIIALMLYCQLKGQSPITPSLNNKVIRISTPKLNIAENDSNTLLLKMAFNGAVPKSSLNNKQLDNVTTVSLVYSKYKLSETFDQLALNAQRMDMLYSIYPQLKENKNIQWYWVEQTGCNNPESCSDFFHGFVITLKSEELEIKRETEIDLLGYYSSMYEGTTDTKKIDSIIAAKKLHFVKVCDTGVVHTRIKGNRLAVIKGLRGEKADKLVRYLRKELKDSGYYRLELIMNKKGALSFPGDEEKPGKSSKVLSLLNDELFISPARFRNKRIASKITIIINPDNYENKIATFQTPILPDNIPFELSQFLYNKKVSVRCEYIDTTMLMIGNVPQTTPDLIFKVFDRNKQWKNCLIATDVTGSMYPYLAQFLMWHKLHLCANSGNHDFVFFNDGNQTPDWLKRTGRVGGIYYVNTDSYEDLNETMNLSMKKGSGGDCPENNIEAVLDGLKRNPNCKEVIMIADNWATPRDLELLAKVKVPIRLILCGTQYSGFNTAYLDMIRENNGSIHTIEKDLYDLTKVLDGQTITLDGKTYVLSGGHFIPQTTTVVKP